jgi:hypothetical protein
MAKKDRYCRFSQPGRKGTDFCCKQWKRIGWWKARRKARAFAKMSGMNKGRLTTGKCPRKDGKCPDPPGWTEG